jgi:putative YphP/YqiW family bacilliredoxin
MYPDLLLVPMREELTRLGIEELHSPDEVDHAVAQPGTTMIVVNSICGCAAGRMRPAARLALRDTTVKPDQMYTVFAGQDADATAQARSYFAGYPPSSPSIALLRDGRLVWMLERKDIEGRETSEIASDITRAFEQFCVREGTEGALKE